jgi:flagellar hook assembly protein FlgD
MPNPFVDGTTIGFSLAQAGHIALRVYDVSGRPVRTLMKRTKDPDRYEIHWDSWDDSGAPVASGAYFYRLEAPGYSWTMKMVFLK